ncbi:hypothetical protein [Streptomyces sp. NPDC049040]|uniref:hypothetical protein n=1 Tax=Streptomyces sp. NPDC049040 TaxID=3365593 RepID=UPI00371E98C5
MKRLFRAVYGESVLHLLVLLASFALCGYAITRLLEGDWWGVVKWVVGAALIHDLVLLPLYGGTDWLLHKAVRGRRPGSQPRIAVVNHVRVPAFLSLLLLLVYWPLISQDAGTQYRNATLLSPRVFFGRWLLISAVLFALSGLLLAFRSRRAAGGNSR